MATLYLNHIYLILWLYKQGVAKIPVSEAKKKANNKWVKENYKRINLALSHEEMAQVEDYCKKNNMSKNAFLKAATKEKLEREK